MDTGKQILQVSSNQDPAVPFKVKSSMIKLGAKTIFFDVNVASNDKKYLKITASRFVGEGKERIRNSFVLFAEDVGDFQKSLKEIISYL